MESEWRLQLNVSKCETCLFTTDSHERSWRPTIKIEEREVPFNENPTFLGIKYDPQLTFGPHVHDIRRKMMTRSGIMGRLELEAQSWSWRHKSRASLEQMDDLGARGVDVTTPVDAQPPWSRRSPIKIRRAQVTKNDTEEVQLEKAREAVDALGNPDVTVCTDGSVVDGTRTGGAGVVVRTGDETIRQWSVPAGARCSSYAAELTAMLEAATWLKRTRDWRRAAIVTDSRTLVDA